MSPHLEGLSLLGAYEDSDEEDAGDAQRLGANSQHNQSADIDSTLANFMAVSILVPVFSHWIQKQHSY